MKRMTKVPLDVVERKDLVALERPLRPRRPLPDASWSAQSLQPCLPPLPWRKAAPCNPWPSPPAVSLAAVYHTVWEKRNGPRVAGPRVVVKVRVR